MGTIILNELDHKFKYEIAEQPGGEGLKNCFACGVCTASCPISKIDEEYSPKRLIRMILLGNREKILSCDLIWFCVLCYTCSFRCPQLVNFRDIMEILRNMAVKEGYTKPDFLKKVKDIDSYTQKIRHYMLEAIVQKKDKEFKLDLKKLVKECLEVI